MTQATSRQTWGYSDASGPCPLLPVLWPPPHLSLIKLCEVGLNHSSHLQMRRTRHKAKHLLNVMQLVSNRKHDSNPRSSLLVFEPLIMVGHHLSLLVTCLLVQFYRWLPNEWHFLLSFQRPLSSPISWCHRQHREAMTPLKVIPGREAGLGGWRAGTSCTEGHMLSTAQLLDNSGSSLPQRNKKCLYQAESLATHLNLSELRWKVRVIVMIRRLCKYWNAFSRQRKSYSIIACIIIIANVSIEQGAAKFFLKG